MRTIKWRKETGMRQIQGLGKIHFADISTLEGNYVLHFRNDGGTNIIFDITHNMSEATPFITRRKDRVPLIGEFSGMTDKPGSTITAPKIFFKGASFGYRKNSSFEDQLDFVIFHPIIINYEPLDPQDEVEIKYGLTNFLFFGQEVTRRGNRYNWDTIRIEVESREIRFTQLEKYTEIKRQLIEREDVQITSEMIMKARYNELSDIDDIANNLRWLCSLASANYVTDLYQDIYIEGRLAKTILKPSKTVPYNVSIPPIDTSIHGDDELGSFLKITYPKFTEHKDELGLEIVIEYYVSSRRRLIAEIRFLLGAITFECIESYLSSYFGSRCIVKDLSSFKSKTIALLDEFGVSYNEDELRIKDTRDKIVHTGRFPSGKNPIEEYTKIINLLDRTLLTILGYKNNMYYNLNSGAREILT